MVVASETYFLTADGTPCEEGDERAAFLLCRKGSEIDADTAAIIAKFKMVKGPPENKAIEPAEDKRMRVSEPRKR